MFIRFVIEREFLFVVDVVDHKAGGLGHAVVGAVSHPVDAFQYGAVAEVEASHGIDRFRAAFSIDEIVGAKAWQNFVE